MKTLPERVSLPQACKALGICRMTFLRRWSGTFTDYRLENGDRRISMDELEVALAETDPHRARAAVMRLRGELGRT